MALNTATLLMRLHTDLTGALPPRALWHSDTINRRNELLVKLQGQIEAFAEKEKTIVASCVLSDEGKREELTKLASDRLATFQWFGRVLGDMDANHERLEATLFDVQRPRRMRSKPCSGRWR